MSQPKSGLSRRTLFAGAGTAGAVAAVAGLAAATSGTTSPQALPELAKPAPEKGGGYSLSEHVKRYYGTARV